MVGRWLSDGEQEMVSITPGQSWPSYARLPQRLEKWTVLG